MPGGAGSESVSFQQDNIAPFCCEVIGNRAPDNISANNNDPCRFGKILVSQHQTPINNSGRLRLPRLLDYDECVERRIQTGVADDVDQVFSRDPVKWPLHDFDG